MELNQRLRWRCRWWWADFLQQQRHFLQVYSHYGSGDYETNIILRWGLLPVLFGEGWSWIFGVFQFEEMFVFLRVFCLLHSLILCLLHLSVRPSIGPSVKLSGHLFMFLSSHTFFFPFVPLFFCPSVISGGANKIKFIENHKTESRKFWIGSDLS